MRTGVLWSRMLLGMLDGVHTTPRGMGHPRGCTPRTAAPHRRTLPEGLPGFRARAGALCASCWAAQAQSGQTRTHQQQIYLVGGHLGADAVLQLQQIVHLEAAHAQGVHQHYEP